MELDSPPAYKFFTKAFDDKNEAFNAHYPTLLSDVMTKQSGNYEGSTGDSPAKEGLDIAAKKMAGVLLKDYNERKAELSNDPETLSPHKLEYAMLDMHTLVLEEAVNGKNFFGVKGKAHPAFQMSSSLIKASCRPVREKEFCSVRRSEEFRNRPAGSI